MYFLRWLEDRDRPRLDPAVDTSSGSTRLDSGFDSWDWDHTSQELEFQ